MYLYHLIVSYLRSLVRREEGQTLSEYALILVLVSIAVIILLVALGAQLNVVFQDIVDALVPGGGVGGGS
jgi:Flp pilus assembly pilin Flp